MIRFEDLLDKVRTYSPDADLELLRKAYVFSALEHKGQIRHSGEPYLVHPLEVADILADMKLDAVCIAVGRLTEQQLQLFFLLQSMVLSYKPEGLVRLVDADVALATGALAGSLETASKGVIFEEATASVVAEGLRRAIKPVLEEITKNSGSRAEREVAIVLRAIERGARHESGFIPAGDTSYLDLVSRVFQQRPQAPKPAEKPLIVLP